MNDLTKVLAGLILFVFALSSCEKIDLEKEAPGCVEGIIREIKREPVRNPPASVWEWKVDGKTYYYITSDCCDQFNFLYDDSCKVVCAPDGGLTGSGDGNCPELNAKVEKDLVWKDNRE